MLTFYIVTTIESYHIIIFIVKIASSLAHIARVAFFAEIGQFTWIVDKSNWTEHLKSLNRAHSNL